MGTTETRLAIPRGHQERNKALQLICYKGVPVTYALPVLEAVRVGPSKMCPMPRSHLKLRQLPR